MGIEFLRFFVLAISSLGLFGEGVWMVSFLAKNRRPLRMVQAVTSKYLIRLTRGEINRRR
jgi:hypothetical protein